MRLMKRVKNGIYPSTTAWTFPDPVLGEIRGEDYDDLVAKVGELREKNKLPVGNPLVEVTDYLCEQNLALCKESKAPGPVGASKPGQPAPPIHGNFGDRVLAWVNRFAEQPRRQAQPPEVIRARADACRACPHNIEYKSTCRTCIKTATRAVAAFTAGYPRGVIQGLEACGRYVWENRVAVGADIVSDSAAPEGCWRRPK